MIKRFFKAAAVAVILVLALFAGVSCKDPDSDSKPDPLPWQHLVTFEYEDNGEVIEYQTVNYGASATVPEIPAERNGIPFSHWSGSFDSVKEDVVIKAVYDYPRYAVSFDSRGGTAIETQRVIIGENPKRPDDPERAGFTFEGWYLDTSFERPYDFDKNLDIDSVLYARYIDDYTRISSAKELSEKLHSDPAKKYILECDINMNEAIWEPISNFTGTLDGNGHKIYNFRLDGTSQYLGFVNTNNGTLKNIVFVGFTLSYTAVNQNSRVGVVAGVNGKEIKNCKLIDGTVQMSSTVQVGNGYRYPYMGGIAGENTASGVIVGCENNVDITFVTAASDLYMEAYIGGIVGINRGTAEKSKMSATITHNGSVGPAYGNSHCYVRVGGIAGGNWDGSARIFECTSNGVIKSVFSGKTGNVKNVDVGLLVGYNQASLVNCLAIGSLSIINGDTALTGYIGGAVGYNQELYSIINVYVDVDITVGDNIATGVGGLLGYSRVNSTLKNSVYSGNINLGADVGGFGFATGVYDGSVFDCYYDSASKLTKGGEDIEPGCVPDELTAEPLEKLQSAEFIFNTDLKWDSNVWAVNEGENPTLK